MRCTSNIVPSKFMPSGLKNDYFPISLQYCPPAWVVRAPVQPVEMTKGITNTKQRGLEGISREVNDDGISPEQTFHISKYVH